MKTNSLIEILQGIRFLRDIDSAHLEEIAEIARISEFDKHDVVFQEGDRAKSVFFVVSGKLSLELSPSTDYRKQLVCVGPGEMLGWSALVENTRFAATAIVMEPARLVSVDGERLRAICDADPQFGYEIMRRTMKGLAMRLTETWRQLSLVYLSHQAPVTARNAERDQ